MVVDGSNNNFCSVRLIKMLPGDESQPFQSKIKNILFQYSLQLPGMHF